MQPILQPEYVEAKSAVDRSSAHFDTLKRKRLLLAVTFVILLLLPSALNTRPAVAQGSNQWTPQQRIPGYGDDANPPVLLADHNRTVHAFVSQPVDEDGGDTAIFYSQWTPENGWTQPNDVLLSPLKRAARVMGAFLDPSGMLHVMFWGGDETEANIYYSSAPVLMADQAPAWSQPEMVGEDAISPTAAVLTGDEEGNLTIVYSGALQGHGLYAIDSSDSGLTWSSPEPFFLTGSDGLWPFDIHVFLDSSGLLHVVWNVRDRAGQGRAIYYANRKSGATQWSEPVKVSETLSGFGTLAPAVIEQDGTVYVVYNMVPKLTMRRSSDDGVSWSAPMELFTQHIGANGTLSLVSDSADRLHLFFGQRIPGSPDIHGMWHSTWLGGNWREPQAVVSGPQVVDMTGDVGFDPYDASAVMVQGNTLLVTWRTDPGMNGNGVRYSARQVEAPILPIEPLPTALPTSSPLPVEPEATVESITTPAPAQLLAGPTTGALGVRAERAQPANPLLFGLIPVGLLLIVVVVWSKRMR